MTAGRGRWPIPPPTGPGPHTAGGDDRRRRHSRTVAGGEDRCGRDHPVHHPSWRRATRTPLPRLDHVGPVRPLPRYDVPVPRLLQARRHLRPGPYDRLSGRADVRVEPEMPMPRASSAQNVLGRHATAGTTDNYPTALSSGLIPTARSTPPGRAATRCSRNCGNPPHPS